MHGSTVRPTYVQWPVNRQKRTTWLTEHLGLWYCESTAALLLAFNRCVDMWSPTLGDALFAGKKTWIWLIIPTLYSLAMCLWTSPVLYNGVYGAWLFNPHAGYLDNVNELVGHLYTYASFYKLFSTKTPTMPFTICRLLPHSRRFTSCSSPSS